MSNPESLANEVKKTLDEQPKSEVPVRSDERKMQSLVVDPGVPGQEWCVMSFVTPVNLQQKRMLNMMDKFLYESINEYIDASTRDMCRRINAKFFKEMEESIAKLERSKNENHKIIAEEMTKIRKNLEVNEEEFASLCTHKHKMEIDDTQAKFEEFVIRRGPEIGKEFDEQHGNQVSVCGIKFSGAFPFQEQAVERAKFLGENVERGVDHYVAQSFHWCPFDPSPNAITDQRYQNKELNRLMEEKNANEQMKNKFFEERKRELMENANKKNDDLKETLKKKYKGRK
jgi:hypothetical protein